VRLSRLSSSFRCTLLILHRPTATVLLPVTPATTLAVLRALLMDALSHGAGDELPELPKAANDIALWRLLHQEEDEVQEDKWERLTDEKSGADKWGL
jgi:hypothetical protein